MYMYNVFVAFRLALYPVHCVGYIAFMYVYTRTHIHTYMYTHTCTHTIVTCSRHLRRAADNG